MALLRNLLPCVLSICLVMVGRVPLANANCIDRCWPMCDPKRLDCQIMEDRCKADCKGLRVYGAIAYGPSTGALGWSYKQDTREEAESVALEKCGARGEDCEVEVSFNDTCAAVSAGDTGRPSWALGATAREAQVNALERCRREGGRRCGVKKSVCSGGVAD